MRMAAECQDESSGWIFSGWMGSLCERAKINYGFADHQAQFVLMAWRDYLLTGDMKFLRDLWPVLQKAMAALEDFDRDGDAIPDTIVHPDKEKQEQDREQLNRLGITQTYDHWRLPASQSYLATLNAAAFRAAETIAGRLGRKSDVDKFRNLAVKASSAFEEAFWNGEYYNLFVDFVNKTVDEGCLADQVNGTWYGAMYDLGTVHNPKNVRSALRAVYKYNRKKEEGLVNGADPKSSEKMRRRSADLIIPGLGGDMQYASRTMGHAVDRDGIRCRVYDDSA